MGKANNDIFFDNLPDFEREAEEEKRRAKLPKEPTFSLSDMEEARKASFDRGHAEGLQQAKDSIEQQTEILVQSLVDRIHDLENAEQKRYDKAIEDSISITKTAIEKLIPSIIETQQEELIQKALAEFFTDHTAKSQMALFVHPDMVKPIEKYAKMINNRLKVNSDNMLTLSQVRLEWEDGQFTFKPDNMMSEILGILGAYLGKTDDLLDEPSKTPHNEENNTNQQDS